MAISSNFALYEYYNLNSQVKDHQETVVITSKNMKPKQLESKLI
jgi:hypothetical protein